MQPKRLLFITSMALAVFYSTLNCKSTVTKKADKPTTLQDNYWYSANKLQIVTQSQPLYVDKPIVFIQKESCNRASNQIDSKLKHLYPALGNIKYQQKIQFTLYYGEGGCRLIVHIVAEDLKNKISQRS